MPDNPTSTPLLNKHQAADYLGVSVSTIDRRRRHGLPAYRLGPKPLVRFRREDLDAWLAKREVAA